MYYNDGVRVPAPLFLDVVSAGISLNDPILNINIVFAEPIPSDIPYRIQVALDADQSAATGEKDPEWYYNQLGIDYLVEYESADGIIQTSLSRYEAGVWVETGSPMVLVDGSTLTVSLDLSQINGSIESSVMVYVIQGISLDMTPEEGTPPLTYIITEEPVPEEPPGIIPDLVRIVPIIYSPDLIEEGTPFNLEASVNTLDPPLPPYHYEWDLNSDGVYEIASESPIYTHIFEQDGEYPVSLKLTVASGLSVKATQILIVQNTPPYDIQITVQSTIDIDKLLSLSATASDKGNDPLTYTWSVDGVTLTGNPVTTSFGTSGVKTISLTVSDLDGGTAQASGIITVNEPASPEPEIDPLLIILVIAFGVGGFFIYNMIKPKKKEEEVKPKEEPKKKKGFCEEHPEVVEEENKICEDALWDLESAVGDVEDNLDAKRDQWRADIREVSRTMMEWDIAYAMIQSLTKSEAEIKKDSETVQKIAAIVKPGGSIGKTTFKKGGEEAMKEVGKHIASEVGKSVASELSSTVSDVLSLETWAYSEIGIGIAKLITGIDPRKEASNIRKESTRTINLLQSWVDSDLARSTRYTPRTLQTCIDECQQLLDDLGKAMYDFENRVAGFRCVNCEISDQTLDDIDKMIKEINDFMKTFGDLIDQVEQRLSQATALYKRKDVYEDPYTWSHAQNNEVPNIKKSLRNSSNAKKK
ncbi:MAG: PKD domain-containing protein [Candidatus Bathyarchaeota archaeon]